MKIAVVTSGFLPVPATKGGAVENLLVNILNENEKKVDITFNVFSIYDEKAVLESKNYKNTSFIFIKPNKFIKIFDKMTFFIAKNILKKENSQSYRYIFQRLYYLNKISKNLKQNNYDKIVLENHPTQYLSLKWRDNYIKYEGKYYYHCHNEFPGTYGCENIIKSTNRIICVSNYISNSIKKYMNMPTNKFVVLRNGINTKQFTKTIDKQEKERIKKHFDIKENEKVLIFTGRIVPEKGIKELINALYEVKNNNYKLLILGSALNELNTRTAYQEEIEELVNGIREKVIFTGFIKYKDIYKYYSIADIAVLPSIWDDPAPLTIIESLVCGLPIITTNSGGIPEYATDGSAIIIKRDDKLIHNLAKNIDALLSDNITLKKMSKIGQQVSQDLTIENYYSNFIKSLEE